MVGKLDRRITFLSRTEGTDALGGKTVTWSNDFTTWAHVIEIKGNEKFEGKQLIEIADIKIRIRHRAGIDIKLRFKYNNNFYDIFSIDEVQRNRYIDILGRILKST